jgi:hypothetical protein
MPGVTILCCGSFLFIPRTELLSFSPASARRQHRVTSFLHRKLQAALFCRAERNSWTQQNEMKNSAFALLNVRHQEADTEGGDNSVMCSGFFM